jgi:RHS repeat-associated protein
MKIHYHSDHLGSASFVTNAEGAVVQHLQYLPYGELFVSQRNTEEFDSRYKFTAKELDNETSYTYFGARYYDTDLSIWLSVDPMSDKYPSLSLYCYTADNPVVLVDPYGTYVDWYRNKTTGEIKWFDREGVQGEIEVIYGEEYENLGSELLKFNGKKLTYYWQTKTKEGKLQLNKKSWNALSGRPLKDKNNLIFDYSKKSQNSKNGPIPEGLWGLKKSGIQYWEDQSLLDKLLNKLGRGEFPGGLNSWGEIVGG